MPPTDNVFAAVLARELRADPGRPLVTFYDFATGERVELSMATYANWVAKTASLLVEEVDLERGQRLLVDLPAHWLTPVFLGAAWTVGLEVVWDESEHRADGFVTGPEGLTSYVDNGVGRPVIATSLLPLGERGSPTPYPTVRRTSVSRCGASPTPSPRGIRRPRTTLQRRAGPRER